MKMNDVVALNIWQFSLVYLLLFVVLFVMKRCKMKQTKLLFVASVRMTVQLILAGLILTYIFDHPHPLFTAAYIVVMTLFSIRMMLRRNEGIGRKFQVIAGCSLAVSGILVLCFFIIVIVGVDLFDPQYTIPISGMIIGNAMTGLSLGLKNFHETIRTKHTEIETLLNMGVHPNKILIPIVNTAVETALLPTLNSMLGLGIISLPGMMTGQILAGTMPLTAILYQIAIMISVCAVTCLSVFCALHFGSRTLYNDRHQI